MTYAQFYAELVADGAFWTGASLSMWHHLPMMYLVTVEKPNLSMRG